MIFPDIYGAVTKGLKNMGKSKKISTGKKKCIDETFTNILGGKEK